MCNIPFVTWDDQLEEATGAWRAFCRTLETTGAAALSRTLTHDEIDLAEGLRHLARMTQLVTLGSLENKDSARPYLWPALDPHRKMGGDNPQGLYLSGPANGQDTFRLRGSAGSARWLSVILSQSRQSTVRQRAVPARSRHDARRLFRGADLAGLQPGHWLQSTPATTGVLVRQFFATPDDVDPMVLTLDNLSAADARPTPLQLDTVVAGLQRATGLFAFMVPRMQGELLDKGDSKNSFTTDIGAPTSTSGGVPGGNAVTARWSLEPDEALVVTVTPPTPCAYWDVQVGNGWYESFDYRHHFCGLTCEGVSVAEDGSVTLVVAHQDPGVENWLEAAGHREGHIAIRWQLTDGNLPIPETAVVKVSDVAGLTGCRRSPSRNAAGVVPPCFRRSTLGSVSRQSDRLPSQRGAGPAWTSSHWRFRPARSPSGAKLPAHATVSR